MKLERAATALPAHGWQLLPLRFHRLDADSVVLTNLVGEHVFVTPDELSAVVDGTCADQELLARLRAAHLIQVPGETLPAELLAIKLRTRMRRLPDSTGLHIFVVTLRCEHTCRYCQVSRQSAAKNEFDMTEETARRALELAFRSPSPHLKIEFQGGEPLLNFPLVRWITAEAKRMNKEHGKDLAFVIATNLALLDEEILDFCAEEQVHISTSLDGPQDLHNGNRRRPGQDSWQQAVAGIRRVQERLGPDRVSALMTTTEASLGRAAEIIDTYAELGLRGVFLRPISPYGFALRRPRRRELRRRPVARVLRGRPGPDRRAEPAGRPDGGDIRVDHREEDAHQHRSRLRRPDLSGRASGSARSSTTTTATSTPATRAGCSPRWATAPSGSATCTTLPTRTSCSPTAC